jgi:dTDP-4-dehydrorhamnose 3,5-epimerase
MTQVRATRLFGLLLLEPVVFADERGFFLEAYHRERHRELGIDDAFVQDNHSRSSRGTVRGLHFQSEPGQAKLVRVSRGRIWDVAVDLRRSSPTFGEWEAFELDDVAHRQLYLPIGFAHGFCVVSGVAAGAVNVTPHYAPRTERGLAWDDPALAIGWPADEPLVSDRDRSNPTLAELERLLPDW